MNKKTDAITVRFTAEDLDTIGKVSKKEGMWASSWIRHVVIGHLIKIGKKKKSVNSISEYGR